MITDHTESNNYDYLSFKDPLDLNETNKSKNVTKVEEVLIYLNSDSQKF